MPDEVQDTIGYALQIAQDGGTAPSVKPLKGFGGANVLEVIENYDRSTYRAVYTVRYSEVIYVLHTFQKKSHEGTKTPKRDLDVVKVRLREAEIHHREHFG